MQGHCRPARGARPGVFGPIRPPSAALLPSILLPKGGDGVGRAAPWPAPLRRKRAPDAAHRYHQQHLTWSSDSTDHTERLSPLDDVVDARAASALPPQCV